MEKFTTLTGVAAPLDAANVDTDQIIPKQFLLAVDRKQELLRDDLVGVDVGGVERSGNARQSRELFHFCMPPQM